jgi:alpha-ketoglutarate-dependent taurine dioxygenase
MALQAGDIQLLSNHTILHARTAYEDAPGATGKRHLLRLWLTLDECR